MAGRTNGSRGEKGNEKNIGQEGGEEKSMTKKMRKGRKSKRVRWKRKLEVICYLRTKGEKKQRMDKEK